MLSPVVQSMNETVEFHLEYRRRFQAGHYHKDQATSGNVQLQRAALNVLAGKEVVAQIIVNQLCRKWGENYLKINKNTQYYACLLVS